MRCDPGMHTSMHLQRCHFQACGLNLKAILMLFMLVNEHSMLFLLVFGTLDYSLGSHIVGTAFIHFML